MISATLSDAQYGLLFGVRRSIRYHDRRRAFFEQLHRLTSALTILLAGSVFFDLAKPGDTAPWLLWVSAGAAALAALDMVVGYSTRATQHRELKGRFVALEMAMLDGGNDDEAWRRHHRARLAIERDEPPIYRALDCLCHNELLAAEGMRRDKHPEDYASLTPWQQFTSQWLHWADLGPG